MGLLDVAPPNGAMLAGLHAILGLCQLSVKRKWLVMRPYPFVLE